MLKIWNKYFATFLDFFKIPLIFRFIVTTLCKVKKKILTMTPRFPRHQGLYSDLMCKGQEKIL